MTYGVVVAVASNVLLFGLGFLLGHIAGFEKAWRFHARLMDQIQHVVLRPGARERLLREGITSWLQ